MGVVSSPSGLAGVSPAGTAGAPPAVGRPASRREHGRSRHAQPAVRRLDLAVAQRRRRGHDLLRRELHDQRDRADEVHGGVHVAELVQVLLFFAAAVHLGLGRGHALGDRGDGVGGRLPEVGGVQRQDHLVEGREPGLVGDLERQRRHAAAAHVLDLDEPRVDAGGGEGRAQQVVQRAGVGLARPGQREQRADEHVAADAAGAVEIQDHEVTLSRCLVCTHLRHAARRAPDAGVCLPSAQPGACMRLR